MLKEKEKQIFSFTIEKEKKNKNPLLRKFGRGVSKFFIVLLSAVLCVAVAFFGATAIVCYGPSDSARGLFVTTVMETSAAKFLARMYLSDDEIAKIQSDNSVIETNETTNTDMIVIGGDSGETDNQPDIEVFDVHGSSFRGKMMVVKDSTRVHLATLPAFSEGLRGKKVIEFIEENDAVAGINAGGFLDTNGVGTGGLPLGFVIKDGKVAYDEDGGTHSVIGFNAEGKFMVGRMTSKQAIQNGVIEGCSFGPILIVNGERAEFSGNGSGLNPRTCIGQRADGSVLMLVIDGRQTNSIGASLEDCVDIMEEYGAVNAANLDGGSSSVLYLNGEMLSKSASVYGPRRMPTAFIVAKEKEKE